MRNSSRFTILGLALALVVSSALVGSRTIAKTQPGPPTLKSIGDQVYCLCGCVTTLNRCPHMPSECASRAEMTALIEKDIAQGKTEPEILQHLTAVYGVKVLAAPPARGFDLSVWVLPGLGLMAGLGLVIVIVRRWKTPPAPPSAGTGGDSPIDPKVLAAVEDEMRVTGLGKM